VSLKVTGFDHVGILTADMAPLIRAFEAVEGITVGELEQHPELGIEILWVDVGGVALEFIRPVSAESAAAAAIRSGGAGVHHIAITVDDTAAGLEFYRSRGIQTRDAVPRPGAQGGLIGFLDPESVAGALVELVEPARPAQ
jgi:methylmalonyl-CoA/ethylmalonyl-CoA epimerase